MTDFDNTNRGALFGNASKTSEKHPDYTGTLNVAGKEWAIAAWERVSKAGKPFWSLQVSEPRKKEEPRPVRVGGKPVQIQDDDDLPFR